MSRRRGFPLLLAACALLVLCARSAHGCSCGPRPTVLDSYEWADVVVVARAVSLEMEPRKGEAGPAAQPSGEESDESEGVEEEESVPAEQKSDAAQEGAKPAPASDERAEERRRVVSTKMLVERVYKGGLKVGEEMVFAQGGGADCVYTFDGEDIGGSYLFYLKRFKDADFWIAGTCGRSRRVEWARDDLLYLNNLDKVRGKTRLSGTLYFARDGGPGVGGRLLRLVGANKKTYEVRTDAGGVYEIYDLPPGRYTVEPEVPQGWKVDGYWFMYSTVYSTIQDVTEPSLRGTAMALYFFAMYVLGASLGPYGTGLVSDFFTARAAAAAGVAERTQQALEPFRAAGLHSAMYVIPVLGALLTLVLFAASRTVAKDAEALQRWMRESSAEEGSAAEASLKEAAGAAD